VTRRGLERQLVAGARSRAPAVLHRLRRVARERALAEVVRQLVEVLVDVLP